MNIIPKPQKSVKLGGQFEITEATKIFSEEIFVRYAEQFSNLVKDCCGFCLNFSADIAQAQIIFTQTDQCPKEGYSVMISEGVATVSASDQDGCLYAVETLRQLFSLDFPQQSLCCNNCYVEDRPKFGYRGLLVDICRHFFPLETLKRIVQLMSRVKLNKLHLHLSDDQGFRVEIEKYPLLNTISSNRGGSEVLEAGIRYVDSQPVGGYLTKAEVHELVQFAAAHNVQVIPELDIPGHSVAMLAAYPQYSCVGDNLEVRKKWGISKDILCVGNPETYSFIKDVLDEICQMFPSEYVHLGGDEAPKDRWCNCKKCREKLAELKLDNFDQLQTHMVEIFRQHLQQKGKKVICWNDGVEKGASMEIVSQLWKPFSRRSGIRQANKGRKTIISTFFNMYFDYPYAMTPLHKTYKCNPTKGVKKSCRQNILGVEGTLWTEYVATEEKLFFNLLPRMLALAECGWGSNTSKFPKRCRLYTEIYDKLGLPYNKSAVGGKRRVSVINKFFREDPNVELLKQKEKETK